MANVHAGKALDELAICRTVDELVHDAFVIWGRLSDDQIGRLSGALHCRYGISQERAHGYLDRAVLQHRRRSD